MISPNCEEGYVIVMILKSLVYFQRERGKTMLVSLALSSMLQLILFTAIPLLYWSITKRKAVPVVPFHKWIGLYRPEFASKRRFLICFITILVTYSIVGLTVSINLLNPKDLANSQFYGLGHAGLFAVFIYSFVQTSLSEEILFRGFLSRVFTAKWGFNIGNTVQAILFGGLHGVMLVNQTGIFPALIVVLITGGIGFSMGMMNERLAGGSIIPGWVLHGATNFISSVMLLYAWI
jgi:membrane protease YdiL (CAAX protease family)